MKGSSRILAALAAISGLFWSVASPASANDSPYYVMMAGIPRVIDGDTLEVQGERVRLHGIDAPEMDQTCRTASGIDYACGEVARDYLVSLTFNRPIRCMVLDWDRYKRAVAVCWLLTEDGQHGTNLNAEMVRGGLALEWPGIPEGRPRYDIYERMARQDRVGLWSGTFVLPWEWRREGRTIEELNEQLRKAGEPI